MSQAINLTRRRFVGSAASAVTAAQFGIAGLARAQSVEPAQSGTAAAAAVPSSHAGTALAGGHTSLGPLKFVDAGVLRVAYAEVGPADGPPVLLLHGWPYDIHSFVDVAPILAAAGYRVLVPYLRGYGQTRFLAAQTPRNAQPAAVATDAIAFLDALQIAQVRVAGFDWGSRTANLLAFLWPERCKSLVSVSGYVVLSQDALAKALPPNVEHDLWYLSYFGTDRGMAGYAANMKAFNRLVWQLSSPKWEFDDATYERSATAFDNPDFVQITLNNYRWYMRLAPGESKYDALERKIATFPTIAIPTITLEGDANGALHSDPASYRKKYTGHYEHRNLSGGIGHNLPQEAPQAFAQAIIDVDRY
jgi:pimeloyl-ACP methyl ester carboxylesterase